MTNSLQDQLLKAGLVSKAQANKTRKSKQKKARQSPKPKAGAGADEKAIAAELARQTKIARDRDLNQKIVARQKRRAAAAEVEQLIAANALQERGDIAFNFPHKRKVKQLNVSKATHARLVGGELGIVRHDGHYRLLPVAVIGKIRQRDKEMFVFVAPADSEDSTSEDYAGFEVPDDLMW